MERPPTALAPGPLRRAALWIGGPGRRVALGGLLLVVTAPLVVYGARAALALRVCAAGDVEDCTKQCDRGSAASCHSLGMMYENGAGIPRDEFLKAYENV